MAKVITTELQHSGASAANITLDSSKNVTCENNLQVDGNVTVTGTLPADKLTGALPAISGASLTGITSSDTLSNRNVLDNGCFAVRQKGDITWNTVSSNTKRIPDRWQGWTNVSGFNIAVTAGTPPIDKGFGTCIKLNNNAAVTPGTNDLIQWQTTLEGQDCQRFKFGTSEAEDLTLSFWCKASATAAGQYGIQLMYTDVGNSGHQCNQKFTAATSWTKHTITFPGTGTAATAGEGILNSTAAGLYVYICLGAGSGKLSGSGTNTWASGGSHVWPTGQHNFLGDTDNELEFTGFQLETGSTATEYEHKSYSAELARCHRYYWEITQNFYAYQYNSSNKMADIYHPQPMRATPTETLTVGNGSFTHYNETIYKFMAYVGSNTSDGSAQYWTKVVFDAEL